MGRPAAGVFFYLTSPFIGHCYIASVSCGIMGEMTIRQTQVKSSAISRATSVAKCDLTARLAAVIIVLR